MGKRAERKTRAAAKEKRATAAASLKVDSPKVVPPQLNPVESGEDGVSVVKERKLCPHLDKGIDLEKFSAKIKASDPSRCEDCREGSSDRRGKRGKGKHGKKKGNASVDSKSDSRAIWVCLDCGHYSCGGVGLPTTPQTHAVRHTRQTRHPLVIRWDNPHLRWCFPCNTLIPVEKIEENCEKKDTFSEVVKLIKGRTTEGSTVDVEDVWFGGGSVTSEMKTEGIVSSGNDLDAKGGYVVRGLTNLGNTCFFNSVMQNLLAMDRVRDYFLNMDASFGPLTIALNKLFDETKPETVREPFLDLSLPVPTKKPPPKKVQPNSRAKKAKLPPKKSGKSRPKINKNPDTVTAQSISNSSASAESAVPLNEQMASSSGDSSQSCFVGPATMAAQSGSASQNVSAVPQSESEQVSENSVVASLDDMTWLDFLEPPTISDEHNTTLQSNDLLFQDSGDKDKVSDDILLESNQIPSLDEESNKKLDASSVNPWEDELPSLAQDSEVILLPYHEETSNTLDILSREAESSSSVMGCGQEEPDFDGFGGLFNEPEIAIGPVAGPSLPNEGAVSGVVVGNSSESDPDEVDDSDSPVSVESCLAHFIKPELLTNDNAWDCEGCTRSLQRQELEALRKQAKLALKTLVNGGESGNQRDLKSTKDISCPPEFENPSNEDMDINLNSVSGTLVSRNGMTDYLNQNSSEVDSGQTCETNTIVSQQEEGKVEKNDAREEQSHFSGSHKSCSQESSPDQADDSCSVDESSSTGNAIDKVQLSGSHESEESNSKEMKFKTVKVKRDATKRVLIDKAPPILTIHLKRFSQDARGRLSKLNGHVNFRETIDLRPYMDPRCIDQEKYLYHLVGVVEHLGTMRGGHYVAYVKGVKSKGKAEKEIRECVWHHVSDAYVREVSLEQVLRCEAYILFYQKIEMMKTFHTFDVFA
ncbi:hypothetical protein LWI29_000538 [Acer saccharum]|uniref:Ubiquitin carboxyl-terminal hydrolase n=1 Tax=Acer saccharum TaxID=4024 RepID=A0AA39W8I0_ACESA|nr:hypothetical protein LWI29_000538 [Acer saccharum]